MHNYYESIVSIKATDKQIINELASQCDHEYNYEAEEMMSDIIRGMNVVRKKGNYTEEEAKEILTKDDDFYWGQYIKAVPFSRCNNAKVKALQKRIDETRSKYDKYINEHRVGDFKSAFIGCPECLSKINKKYFIKLKETTQLDKCPVCHASMMSETMKKTLDGYKEKIKALEKEQEAEKKKNLKSPTHYMIIAGIHS